MVSQLVDSLEPFLGRATGCGWPGRDMTGAGGATGILEAGLITGGAGRYIFGND